MFHFHQFPYDVVNDSVYEPMFKVACTGGSSSDGTIPLNMPFATYSSFLNPSGDYQGLPVPCGIFITAVGSVE